MNDRHNERRTLTVEECAKVLGIGRSAAYEAVRSGQIPTIRVGRRFLIPKSALDRLLDEAGLVTANERSDRFKPERTNVRIRSPNG
jgi:excisionase family DNA binding protein